MRTVKQEWESYEKRVLSPGAGPVQRRETRRAFYAGAASMIALLSDAAEGRIDVERLLQELSEFGGAVRGGRA